MKGLYLASLALAGWWLVWAPLRGYGTFSGAPEPVGADPSVRVGSTGSPRYVFLGGGYHGGK